MRPQTRFFKDYRKLANLLNSGAVFTAFDTETTGLNSEQNRVIEIGAVKFSLEGISGIYNVLVNPQCIISPEIENINHISNKMVADKPYIDSVLPDFLDFIQGTILIAHNAHFDVNFITAELEHSRLPPINNMVIDTLNLSRWAYPSLGKYNLQFLAEMMGIEVKNAHRACDDARVCGNIFLRCIKDTASVQKL